MERSALAGGTGYRPVQRYGWRFGSIEMNRSNK
jgi:hypothetical protein